jgi:hypothetical protein
MGTSLLTQNLVCKTAERVLIAVGICGLQQLQPECAAVTKFERKHVT